MRLLYSLTVLLLLAIPGCSTGDVTDAPPDTPSLDAIVDEVCTITSELMGVDRSQVKPTTSLGDLGCDELDFVELVMEIEEEYNISIPDETAEQLLGSDDWQAGMKNVTMQKLADAVRARRK